MSVMIVRRRASKKSRKRKAEVSKSKDSTESNQNNACQPVDLRIIQWRMGLLKKIAMELVSAL